MLVGLIILWLFLKLRKEAIFLCWDIPYGVIKEITSGSRKINFFLRALVFSGMPFLFCNPIDRLSLHFSPPRTKNQYFSFLSRPHLDCEVQFFSHTYVNVSWLDNSLIVFKLHQNSIFLSWDIPYGAFKATTFLSRNIIFFYVNEYFTKFLFFFVILPTVFCYICRFEGPKTNMLVS